MRAIVVVLLLVPLVPLLPTASADCNGPPLSGESFNELLIYDIQNETLNRFTYSNEYHCHDLVWPNDEVLAGPEGFLLNAIYYDYNGTVVSTEGLYDFEHDPLIKMLGAGVVQTIWTTSANGFTITDLETGNATGYSFNNTLSWFPYLELREVYPQPRPSGKPGYRLAVVPGTALYLDTSNMRSPNREMRIVDLMDGFTWTLPVPSNSSIGLDAVISATAAGRFVLIENYLFELPGKESGSNVTSATRYLEGPYYGSRADGILFGFARLPEGGVELHTFDTERNVTEIRVVLMPSGDYPDAGNGFFVVTVESTIYYDLDGDGTPDDFDPFPDDPTQTSDRDEDGFGDYLDGNNPDLCPDEPAEPGGEPGCPVIEPEEPEWSPPEPEPEPESESGQESQRVQVSAADVITVSLWAIVVFAVIAIGLAAVDLTRLGRTEEE